MGTVTFPFKLGALVLTSAPGPLLLRTVWVYSKNAGKLALQSFHFVPSFPGSSFCSCKLGQGIPSWAWYNVLLAQVEGAILWMLIVYCRRRMVLGSEPSYWLKDSFLLIRHCWSHISNYQKSQPWFSAQVYVTVKALQTPIESWSERSGQYYNFKEA